MTATWDNLTTAVKAKLDALSGSGQILAQVYQYHETAPAGFPAVTFEPSNHNNVAFTTTDNLRGYAFDIIVYQEFSALTMTRDAALGILRRAVDAIVTAFDADINLSGACDYTLPLPGNFGFMEGANGSQLWATLTLVCYSEIQVT